MSPTTPQHPEQSTPAAHWLDLWHVAPSVNRDYDFIDGLRGAAILMVVVAHHIYINPNSGKLEHWVGAFLQTGVYGLPLFFALSGFLISWPFWKRKISGAAKAVPQGYFQRRFWKIYPPLALSVLVFTPIYITLCSDWSFITTAAQWLTGVAFVVPVNGRLNAVMWSLVVEVQFYVTLPLLFLALKRLPAKSCLLIVTLLFLLVPFAMRLWTGQAPAYFPKIDVHYPSGMDVFCLGILIAGLDNLNIKKEAWGAIGVLGVVLWPLAMMAGAWLALHPAKRTFFANEAVQAIPKIASGCLLFFIANPRHAIARLLCTPWLRWLGIVSYEWYLFHLPWIAWARVWAGSAGGSLFKYVLVIGCPLMASLIFSALVFRYFSLPILKYGRDKNKR